MNAIPHVWRLVASGVYVALCLSSPLAAEPDICQPVVTINHGLGTVSPDGVIQLRHQQCFKIAIINTDTSCILVNLKDIEEARTLDRRTTVEASLTDFEVRHHETNSAYEVQIDIKDERDCKARLKALTRLIPVETYGWTLGIAGAFTADGLTDPVFFLDSGTRPKPDEPATTETGFFVRERSNAEDDFQLGAATFVHLYHNDPDRLGSRWINWVPLSFGLGISSGSEARYFFGTGVRFGTRAFLTGGAVLGSRDRLPEKLFDGAFTTDQNALGSLPDKTEAEWFVSLSIRGLDIDVSKLSAPFKTSAPAP